MPPWGFCALGFVAFLQRFTFDDGALLRNLDLQDFARLAFAVTGDNLNLIPFLNM